MCVRVVQRSLGRVCGIAAASGLSWLACGAFAHADDFLSPAAAAPISAAPAPDAFHELESKYLFGFTEGSHIGEQGEQSIEFENTAAFAKRGGRYSAVEQEIEYENVPSQDFGYELSAHGAAHDVKNVDGLGDFSGANFSGLSAEFRYLVIGRGPGSPFGLTLVAEPEWERIDGESGMPTADFSTTFRLAVDTEIIPNHLFAAANLIYAPEIGRPEGGDWERASQIGAAAALAYRVSPKLTVGGEVEYYRAYDGLAFHAFDGNAFYAGPTLHIQISNKVMLAAAFSTQVAGRAAGESNNLDLTNFERYHSNLKLEFEF
jgi:hypothetical protein